MSCDSNRNSASAAGIRNGIQRAANRAAYAIGTGLASWAGFNVGAVGGGVVGAITGEGAGAIVGAAVGGTIGAVQARRVLDNALASRRKRAEVKAWRNRDIEAENRHITEAKSQGLFYDNRRRQTVSTKYIVAGVIGGDQYKYAQGQAPVDKLEFYDQDKAWSMAAGAGYSIWRVSANKNGQLGGDSSWSNDTSKISYTITNMITGEDFVSPEEPYGRRPEPDSMGGTVMEKERPEADQPHEIIDSRSNQIMLGG